MFKHQLLYHINLLTLFHCSTNRHCEERSNLNLFPSWSDCFVPAITKSLTKKAPCRKILDYHFGILQFG